MELTHWKKLIKGEYSLKDVIDYFRGTIRYYLYYHDFDYLIRKHIKEQYLMRIKVMDTDCRMNGYCKLCGCKTTALQMANKSCEKPCYPKMVNKKTWNEFKSNQKKIYEQDKNFLYVWSYPTPYQLELEKLSQN